MLPRNIPSDMNIELLLSYFQKGSFKVNLKGPHKRNVYNDMIGIEEGKDGVLYVDVGRNGLYNVLPEYMFHPIDRFNNLPQKEEKERFLEEYEKQEREKELAHRFFAPVDLLLLMFKVNARERLRAYTDINKVLIDIIFDDQHPLSEAQRGNRFVKQAIPFVIYSKYIRGNKTLLTLLLRKVFMDEGLTIATHENCITETDLSPRYADGLNGPLNETYIGNVYDETVKTYDLFYWPELCDGRFLDFVNEVDVFRRFVEDYFLSVEEVLRFFIIDDKSELILPNDEELNYLGYNTNL